ncbi:hypothetical protein [Oricola nitratireducens]|nr:hypothetical protein [Oricola nitratireducens]
MFPEAAPLKTALEVVDDLDPRPKFSESTSRKAGRSGSTPSLAPPSA